MSSSENGDELPTGSHEGDTYPEFPQEHYSDQLTLPEKEAFLDYYGFLPEDYEDIEEGEQEAYLDEYESSIWEQDVENAGGETDSEMEHIFSEVGEDIPDRETGSSMVDGVPLALEDEIELVGNNDPTVIVGDVDIIGAYLYRRQSEGFESQYLVEIESGGSGGEENPYDADTPPEGDGGGGGGPGSEPTGGESPPETVIIEAYVGYDRMQTLRDMRTSDETFEVQIEDSVLEDMELISVTAEVTGQQPFAFYSEIEVREWREYTVDEQEGGEGSDESPYGGSGETDDTDGEPEDVDESGTPDEPRSMETEAGESRNIEIGDGERIRNAEIDASAEGSEASVNASGSDWAVEDVGIRGGGESRPALLLTSESDSVGEVRSVMIDGDEVMADGIGYDVVDVEGGVEIVEVGPGEIHEHVLYNVTNGGRVAIIASGEGWAVKDIGIDGEMDSGVAISASVPEGGEATIENVYLGDGTLRGKNHGTGIYTESDHEGHLHIQQANVGGMNEYSIDTSDSTGSVSIDRTYSANPGDAHFLVGEADIDRSTVVNDNRAGNGTGIRAIGGEVTVNRCQMPVSDSEYAFETVSDRGEVVMDVRRTHWNDGHNGGYREGSDTEIDLVIGNSNEPEDLDPQGCPQSALAAATGNTFVPPEGVDDAPPREKPRFGEAGYGEGGFGGSDDWGTSDAPDYTGPMPPPAIYVDANNSPGDIHIHNVYIRNWPGRGIYAVSDGDSGNVTIENVFVANCRGVQIELGSDSFDDDFE